MSPNDGIQGSGASAMPARNSPIELRFERSTTKLNIRCVPGKHVYVAIHDGEHRQLAFAVAHLGSQPERFALDRKCESHYNEPALWIGCAAFDLSAEEADLVEQTLAGCGLAIEKAVAA